MNASTSSRGGTSSSTRTIFLSARFMSVYHASPAVLPEHDQCSQQLVDVLLIRNAVSGQRGALGSHTDRKQPPGLLEHEDILVGFVVTDVYRRIATESRPLPIQR